MRNVILIALGLLIGGIGAVLYLESMPPAVGSAEERALKLEVELKRVRNQLTSLEAELPGGRRRGDKTVKDGARSIAEDIRAGRPVTPDDVFRATQPFIRDFSPLFNRMREIQMQEQSDSMAGEYARKYGLTKSQQADLKKWFDAKAAEDAENYTRIITQEGVTLRELSKATYDMHFDDGLDTYMANQLSGQKLAAFKSDRMLKKVERVQSEADRKVERLDRVVQLDDTQRGQLFGMMARSSQSYDPAMQFEGVGTNTALETGESKEAAVLSILNPKQREAYQADRIKRKADAQAELAKMGMTLPADWDADDQFDF